MCLSSGKTPKPLPVAQAPAQDTKAKANVEDRRRAAEQRGVYDNIWTSPLGDSKYGTNVGELPKLAAFGAA